MNIGMMITPKRAVPPNDLSISAPRYLVSELSDRLAEKGHSVYLFAPKFSKTKAILCDFGIAPTILLKDSLSPESFEKKVHDDEQTMFRKMIEYGKTKNIELYHLHQAIHMEQLIRAAPGSARFVITLHDELVGEQKDAVLRLANLPNCWFVSISDAQRVGLPAPFIGTVMHGIETDLFAFSSQSQGYIASVGRIIPKKGQDDAIAATKTTRDTLYILGEKHIDVPEYQTYWKEKIAPYVDKHQVTYVPVVPRTILYRYYQGAKAMLMPIKWEEPFGMVMIESMSCGTPVIAYNRGSVPEIVKDGVTGFIIDPNDEKRPGYGTWKIKKQGIDGLVEALQRIEEIDRAACRRHVEDHFTVEKMVEGYEQVYTKILTSKGETFRS